MPNTPGPTTATPTPTATPTAIIASASGITPELLTERQAAELLGMGARTLWRYSRSGICPAPIKIGIGPRPAVRYRRSELLAWVQDGCPRCDGRAAR